MPDKIKLKRMRTVTECNYDSVTKKETCKKVRKRMTKQQYLRATGKIKSASQKSK